MLIPPSLIHTTMKSHPQSTKKEALILLQHGHSHQLIAERLGVGRTTITEWAGDLPPHTLRDVERPKAGRPRKLTIQDAQNLKLMFRLGKVKSALQATKAFNKENESPVSANTIRRALHEIGGEAKRVIKKPFLTREHRKARKEFADKYKDWTEDDWSRVVWTDESKISRIHSDGNRYIWIFNENHDTQRNKKVIDQSRVIGTAKHGGGSIIVWGCMTWEGPGYLVNIKGGLDAHLYISILKEDLMATLQDYNIDPDRFIFQQDNDPKHKASLTMEYLKSIGLTEESERYLPWPPQSADLNPIEHLWKYVNDKLDEYPEPAKGMVELWERLAHEWYNISKETCRNLIRSMPNRLQAVIEAKGGPTGY